ncbi:MAG: efflux RND transporter periplasmic adaptor subunit [Proteobacteria bacterium]|nr:MAG: efflux RND transporter periplasmic adaptor subunit [Pseudomonadota bacterium]
MRLVFRLFITLALLGAIFGGIFYLKFQQGQRMAQMQMQPQPPAVVAATEARAEQWQPAIRSVGSLKAVNGIAVTTEVAGTIRAFEFESGKRVKVGDVLVRLEDSVDQAALKGLIADRELARIQFERASELSSRRAISQSEIDETRFRYEGIQARVQEQQASIAKKTIRAPFDGLLGLRLTDIGEFVSPGDDIVRLQALDPIYVDYAVSEREFRNLSEGQKVLVTVPAYPEREFAGTISAIESGVDESTRSIRVRATLENDDAALRPGMFAEVRTLRSAIREVVTVPRTAISFNTYGDYAFVIEDGEGGGLTVNRRNVKTGAVREGRIEIIEGVDEGERVVRTGLVKLRAGQAVTIDNSVELDDAGVTRQ